MISKIYIEDGKRGFPLIFKILEYSGEPSGEFALGGIRNAFANINVLCWRGELDILICLHQAFGILPNWHGAHLAVIGRQIKVLRWLAKREIFPAGCSRGADLFAEIGDLNYLQKIWKANRSPPSQKGIYACIKKGHLDVFKWLVRHDLVPWSSDVADVAAEYGRMDFLKWMFKPTSFLIWNFKRGISPSPRGLELAIANSHKDVVDWYMEKTNPEKFFLVGVFDQAAKCGNLDMILWAAEKYQLTPDSWVLSEFVIQQDFDSAETLIQRFHDVTILSHIINLIAEKGELDSLQWIYTKFRKHPSRSALNEAWNRGYTAVYNWGISVLVSP